MEPPISRSLGAASDYEIWLQLTIAEGAADAFAKSAAPAKYPPNRNR